jgi:hypothetical protein
LFFEIFEVFALLPEISETVISSGWDIPERELSPHHTEAEMTCNKMQGKGFAHLLLIC